MDPIASDKSDVMVSGVREPAMYGLFVLLACFKSPASTQLAEGRELVGSFRAAVGVARSLTPLTCLSGGLQSRSAQTLLEPPESNPSNVGDVRKCLTLRGGDESSKKKVRGIRKEIKGVEKEIKSAGRQNRRRHAELREDKKQLWKKVKQPRQLLPLKEEPCPKSPLPGASMACTESEARLDGMGFCKEEKYFRLDRSCSRGTNVNSGEHLLLYCRQAFLEQFRFLREQVLEHGALGWIQGCPGTGKTTTTLSFCMVLDRNEWSFTCIRLKAISDTFVVEVSGNRRRTYSVATESEWKQMTLLLEGLSDSKKSLMVLDGYLSYQESHKRALVACVGWREADRQNRRLVVVMSSAFRGKIYDEEDRELGLKEHIVPSWRIDEYLEAVQFDEFYNQVAPSLEMNVTGEILSLEMTTGSKSKQQRVRHKHYLAGGSCRYMFDMTAAEVLRCFLGGYHESADCQYEHTDSLPHTRACLKPISEFQGGYDAIIVDQDEKVVQFFQLTVSMDHSLKLWWDMDDKDCFVVPPENKELFRIAPVEDAGALEQYMWKKGEELSMAQVAKSEARLDGAQIQTAESIFFSTADKPQGTDVAMQRTRGSGPTKRRLEFEQEVKILQQ
ncbi:hypothetical protein GUITHDRAFT_120269 [Guillardia theta CCMP2712]|uniref:Uncharacterized protein n=1 Tax=Guillardia theta (strain CCMP2712) TaxID=905079 RepID=L1IC65_GUITC|nr:hypothetical protein GUITHDRAFT_120269 [Guillardia theta CCMP2712]EKX33524.1 hypothetical protein GUITHDRAFT_120269 [Guillardia theta CCMP2712]|eukprot:XP_005820504.1 hypothetical protein GUITHDRAFT_120269 [Guillardia theta CCMP2712]